MKYYIISSFILMFCVDTALANLVCGQRGEVHSIPFERTFTQFSSFQSCVEGLEVSVDGLYCKLGTMFSGVGVSKRFDSQDDCLAILSQSREGFYCIGKQLYNYHGAITAFESSQACSDMLAKAKQKLVCTNTSLRSAFSHPGGFVALYRSQESCMQALELSK